MESANTAHATENWETAMRRQPTKETFATKDEWLEARRLSLGGSDAPIVAGVSHYGSPLSLYCEKLGIAEIEENSNAEYLRWGNLLEPLIANEYAAATKRPLVDHGINLFRAGFDFPAHASLDREIEPVEGHDGPGVLQIKSSGILSMKQIQEDGIQLDWAVQIQHEIAVMNYKWGSFAILMFPSRKLGWVDVERNDRFIDVLLEQERAFTRRLLDHDPPEPDASEATKKILKALYPKDSGETVALPVEADEWHTGLVKAKAESKHWNDRADYFENQIKNAIGNATFGLLPDRTKYSWKLQNRDGYYVKPTEFRVLRLLKN
jgi:predicted phage-related endonuclease